MNERRAVLSEFGFANSLAVLAACFYLVFLGSGLAAPQGRPRAFGALS